jgi:hypothetical protein
MNSSCNKSGISAAGLLLALLAMIIAPGCKKDFLSRKPLGRYTSQNYPYPAASGPFAQYINAAYATLRTYDCTGFGFIGAVSIRSDDADKGSTPQDAPTQIEMDNFPVSPTNSLVSSLWSGYYDAISKCNIVLHEVGIDSLNTPENTKLVAEAQARFIRGYAYFMLVRLFGGVPIIDTVLANVSSANVKRSSSAEVYSFIEQDLQFAAAHLPLTWPPKFVGGATRGSANGMLAKVYLYEKKWQQAMDAAGQVISSGVYDLNTPYDKIFTESGENCSGSVFEIQAYADANHKTEFGCQYAQLQGVRGVGWANLGWGFNDPSPQLIAAYEPGDPREASTVLYCPSPQPTRYGEVFPVEPDPTYNMKVYTDPAWRQKVGSQAGYWMNVRILRYSDVLLMYAEAANELGQTDWALAKLEMVRARARAGNANVLPEITERDQATLRKLIWHERRIELAMESERFFDIVRWGIADSVLHADGKTNFVSSRDDLLPIPQSQIDISNGVLEQNPGY